MLKNAYKSLKRLGDIAWVANSFFIAIFVVYFDLMGKDYFLRLAMALYRVTDFFPEKEPLKSFLRKKANEILADLILIFSENPVGLTKEQKKKYFEQILRNIEILQGYFEVARRQKWVREVNFLLLKKEYDKIEKEIKKALTKREGLKKEKIRENVLQLPFDSLRRERCKKILEILEEKEMQVKDLKEIFPQVSKRTLRRDLDHLSRQGLVKRIGERNMTLYRLGRTEMGQQN